MKLTTPPLCKPGDRAYIISPSAGILPFAPERVERAKKHLGDLGFEVIIAPHARGNIGYLSGSIEERVSDIHLAFQDKKCSLIMASIGGNHSNQLIERLDYELIRQNPKAFVGYSDNTVLHLALLSKAGLQTFYGPCFMNQFGEFPEVQEYTLTNFKHTLFDGARLDLKPSERYTDEVLDWFKKEDSTRARKLEKNDGYVWWKSGKASGWALPGAIPSFNHILGTHYMPSLDEAVLMIDIPEGHSMHEGMSVADVDAWLTDLDVAGVLKKIKALVVGRPYKYSQVMITQLKEVVLRTVSSYNYPVLYNFDFGHTDPILTIPYGTKISIDSINNRIHSIK